METLEELAQKIVDKFENNMPFLHNIKTYQEEREDAMLYLSAKAYLERYQ